MLSNVNLLKFNTMGVAAVASHFVEVHTAEELKETLREARALNVRPFILGEGANLLIATEKVNRVVIKMAIDGFEVVGESATHRFVRVGAGENWHATLAHMVDVGLAGMENLALIPSSVGASVVQNIGAFGAEVSQFVHEVQIYDPLQDKEVTLTQADCDFRYRHSIFKTPMAADWVVLSVTFALAKDWKANLSYQELARAFENQTPTPRAVFEAVVAARQRRLPDPKDLGSAGSFFKNPIVSVETFKALYERFPHIVHYPMGQGRQKLAAGWLIDQAGLRGARVGDAGTYEKQALVLVNHGKATGLELWRFSQKIEEAVFDKFGVHLEPEPVILFD